MTTLDYRNAISMTGAFCATVILLGLVSAAQAATQYHYVATTKAKAAAKQGPVKAGLLTWKCERNECRTSDPRPTLGISDCKALAQIVGPVASVGYKGNWLASKELDACNEGTTQVASKKYSAPRVESKTVQRSTKVPTSYDYIATTKAEGAMGQGVVKTRTLTWDCKGNECRISGPWPTPAVNNCQTLAEQVGPIASFGYKDNWLSSKELNACNAGIKEALPSRGVAKDTQGQIKVASPSTRVIQAPQGQIKGSNLPSPGVIQAPQGQIKVASPSTGVIQAPQGQIKDAGVGSQTFPELTEVPTPSPALPSPEQYIRWHWTLSGGGAKGSFQVGALKYLVERLEGYSPISIASTSVGSINALTMAEGTRSGYEKLEKVWLNLRHNYHMFVPASWVQGIPSRFRALKSMLQCAAYPGGSCYPWTRQGSFFDPQTGIDGDRNVIIILDKDHGFFDGDKVVYSSSHYFGGVGRVVADIGLRDGSAYYVNAISANTLSLHTTKANALGDTLRINLWPSRIGLWQSLTSTGESGTGERPERIQVMTSAEAMGLMIADLLVPPLGGSLAIMEASAAQEDINTLIQLFDKAQFLYSLAPVAQKTRENIDIDRILRSGIKLRLVSVGLETGQVQYVTENGEFISRHSSRVTPVQLQGTATEAIIAGALASAGIPGVFPPVVLQARNGNHSTSVDGGVRDILPIRASLEIIESMPRHRGGDGIIAISATSAYDVPLRPIFGTPPERDFRREGLLSISGRSLGLLTTEILLNEFDSVDELAIPTILIKPSFNVHGTQQVDPGLILISMAYGYMAAFDEFYRFRSGNQDEYNSLVNSTQYIIQARKHAWELEERLGRRLYTLHGWRSGLPIRYRENTSFVEGLGELQDLMQEIRELKRGIFQAVNQRLERWGAQSVPREFSNRDRGYINELSYWWASWERHEFIDGWNITDAPGFVELTRAAPGDGGRLVRESSVFANSWGDFTRLGRAFTRGSPWNEHYNFPGDPTSGVLVASEDSPTLTSVGF